MGRRYIQTESKMTALTDWRVRKAVKDKDSSGLDNLDCEKSPAYYYGSFLWPKKGKNGLKQLKIYFFSALKY